MCVDREVGPVKHERWHVDGYIRVQREEIERSVARHDAQLLEVFEGHRGRRGRPLREVPARRAASIAELECDRLGVAWRQAKLKMVERGAWPAPNVPFGYRKTRRGRLVPDPVSGPMLFARRAAGSTARSSAPCWRTKASGRRVAIAAGRSAASRACCEIGCMSARSTGATWCAARRTSRSRTGRPGSVRSARRPFPARRLRPKARCHAGSCDVPAVPCGCRSTWPAPTARPEA